MRFLGLIVFCALATILTAQSSDVHSAVPDSLVQARPAFGLRSILRETPEKFRSRSIMNNEAKMIPGYTSKHYGFFCRLEERNTPGQSVVAKFRLGSVSHVNYLEGKETSSPPPPNQ